MVRSYKSKTGRTKKEGQRYPDDFEDRFCEDLINHGKQGLTFNSFITRTEAARSTLYSWLNKYPEFKKAKELSDAYCELFWEKKGASPGKNYCFSYHKMLMINKFGYKDKPVSEEDKIHYYIDFDKWPLKPSCNIVEVEQTIPDCTSRD